ncbi:TetR/AcrR family transcriptional regulator [Alloscardovia sp. HMSC034E08]|uniref:TetR/AcrR family transcriptional regulator n=1 Tax=Alloscardovia sp. HMSC034E08 TaxID=1739413 RepID=UPI00210F8252|nr:TetR/AcrR family transcriptional regulator [Alloscardovia sp. HMSC034E08]
MSAQDRLNQIVEVAVRLIHLKGYHGMSLRDIAEEIGISQTAVIHRVGSKRGLLVEVIKRYYDATDASRVYLSQFEPGGDLEGGQPRIPAMLRAIVMQNVQQPEMVRLFEVLNTEAMSPEHPAHEYFTERPTRIREEYRRYNWKVPSGVDGEFVYMMTMAAMYGLEGRWLGDPAKVDFVGEWEEYEEYLFPSPLWDGYR